MSAQHCNVQVLYRFRDDNWNCILSLNQQSEVWKTITNAQTEQTISLLFSSYIASVCIHLLYLDNLLIGDIVEHYQTGGTELIALIIHTF